MNAAEKISAKPSVKSSVKPTADKSIRVICKDAPIAQVVNNSGMTIHQVKVGSTLFSANLSRCSDGCSTGFKDVRTGRNNIMVKISATGPWTRIGSLRGFETCKKYAVNIVKRPPRNLCAVLYQRFNTDPTFQADKTKKKLGRECSRMTILTPRAGSTAGSSSQSVSGRVAGNAQRFNPGSSSRVQMNVDHPVISNISFGRAVDTTSMALAPGASSASSSDRVPRLRQEYGTRLALGIRFTTEYAGDVQVRLQYPEGGQSNLRAGEGRDLGDGRKRYIFEHEMTALEDQVLTLIIRATGQSVLAGFVTEERQVEIDVRSPRLRVQRPEFDNDTRQLTFSIRNAGNLDLTRSGRIRYSYSVMGISDDDGANGEIASRSFSSNQRVGTGETVTFDPITLPEDALAYERFEVTSTVTAECNGHDLPEVEQTHRFEWETKTSTIRESLIQAFSSILSGEVHVNTFKRGTGKATKSKPYENDSNISLSVDGGAPFNQSLDIPSFKFGSDGVEALVLIDNLNATIGEPDMFFVRDGKLGLRIEFDCSASKEIEVWARDAIAKKWRDNWLPDLDLRGFSIELKMTPVKKGQAVSYEDLDMDVNVNLEIPGHRIERWLERVAAREIKKGFAPMLDSAELKTAIEGGFEDILSGFLHIRHLVSVGGSGDSIVITYR